MTRAGFYEQLRQGLLGPILSQSEVDGCNAILDATEGWDEAPRAYVLATAWHETWHRMQPVREVGSDAYFRRRYDPEGLNPGLARRLGNIHAGDGVKFAGRGFVQLTGRDNYARVGQVLGLPLEDDPDLALKAPIAARILAGGMEQGLFTGKQLSDYFGEDRCEPQAARAIVNGTDKADEIAGYFQRFRSAL